MKITSLSIWPRLQQISRLGVLALAILSAGLTGMRGISPSLAQARGSQVNSMMNGLLMYLPLDEPAGSCGFIDLSGNGHGGAAASGACPTAGQAGRFYGAVAFNGVYNHIQVANSPSLNFGSAQDFTVLMWMKSGSLRSWDALISSKEWWGGAKSGFILSIDSSGSKWTANAADGTHRADVYSNGPDLSDDQWHYLAVTFDRDGQMVMYQDGVQVGSASMVGVGSIDSGLPIYMGNTYAAEEPYAGQIDEIMLYNRVLTPTEIAALMQGDCTVSDGSDSGDDTLRGKLADNTCRTIYFASDYTITLTQPLVNGRSVTVDGSGRNIIISANHNSRVLDNSGSQVTLVNLTLRDGWTDKCSSLAAYAGAGIYQHGYSNTASETLTLINCTITDNHSDTCYGGGIFNDGVVVRLINSTVANNYGFWGGGINDFGGSTTIINSTLANNRAFALGGGIATTFSTITIDNSSLVNNRADGNSGADGGGIFSRNEEDVIVIRNSLIASSPTGGNCAGWAFEAGTANNLSDDATCGSGFTYSGNILLGALGNYGGSTDTFPLLPGSAAIDAGDPAVCAASGGVNHLDQRGRARPDSSCDIGAFESQGFSLGITGGDLQSAPINTAFAQPLAVEVIANDTGEPVNGGLVTFAGPSTGASTNPVTSTVSIVGGGASLAVAANDLAGGPYSVAASSPGAASVNFNLTNDKQIASLTLSDLEHTYDGTPKSAIVATNPAGLGFKITYAGSVNPPTEAGHFVVVATVEDPNYQGSLTGTLVIASANLTVTGITAADKVYNGSPAAEIDASGATLAGVISGDDVALDASGAAGAFADHHVGVDKPVVIGGLALAGTDAGNYILGTPAPAFAAITSRPITVTADAQSKVYGTADPALTYQATASSLATGDSFSGELSRAAGENAGIYAISQGTLTASSDYALTFVGANLTITQAPARLILGNLNQSYTGTPRPITVTTVPAGLNGVKALYDGSPDAPTNAGSYKAVASLSNINYQAEAITGSLMIAKADPTAVLQASAHSVPVGQAVTLTLTLNLAASVTGIPTGEITFMDGNAILGSAPFAYTNGSFQARLSLSNLSVGVHTLGARYAGDPNFSASVSNSVLLTVVTNEPLYNTIYLPVVKK